MDKIYIKNYDSWNSKKKRLDARILPMDFFFLEREVWWAAIGINIGREEDGKNTNFERPVLVLNKISYDLLLIAPYTSTVSENGDGHLTFFKGKTYSIMLGQLRTVSANRLLRLMYRMEEEEFTIIKEKAADFVRRLEIPR
jgi:mRNA interferase MazF